MGKFTAAACATGLAIALGAACAASAPATILAGSGQGIQAAVSSARTADVASIEPGAYRQRVLIRTDGITVRGSGDFRRAAVLEPPSGPYLQVTAIQNVAATAR